jgi:hypothetical protein
MSCPSVVSPNLDNMSVALGVGHLSLQVLVTQAQVSAGLRSSAMFIEHQPFKGFVSA